MKTRTAFTSAAILILSAVSSSQAMPTGNQNALSKDSMGGLVVNVAQRSGCRSIGRMRSIDSDVAVTVTFRNRSGSFRSVNWIGFDGRQVQYAGLNDGESFTINTFLTHPWVFTDGPGNCIETYMPAQGQSRFTLRKPSRGGGD